MHQDSTLRIIQDRLDAVVGAVKMLTVETSVLQELCAALMAELAMQSDSPAERLEQLIEEEQRLSYAIASDLDDVGDGDGGDFDAMWDLLVDHAEVRNRAFNHARMTLARILGEN